MPLPTAGFGDLGSSDIVINGASISSDLSNAVVDCILERTIQGASTVVLQLTDPIIGRPILNSGLWTVGTNLTLDGLSFSYVAFEKASDQLQVTFEATGVNQLRQQFGATATTSTTDITGFAAQLVSEVPGLDFIGEPGQADTVQDSVGRGTTSDPNEDSWTCLQRIASTAGWRCFEADGIIFFGSDQFFLSQPIAATFQEFTDTILDMDFTWDFGQPFGDLTATAILSSAIDYIPGQPVSIANLGQATGIWLISDMQRDLFNPQASITCTIPLTPEEATSTSSIVTTTGFG